MQFNNPTSTKRTKYDNSTLQQIKRPLAFATRSPSDPARARLLCAFADSTSGTIADRHPLGKDALKSITTGVDDTALGYQALKNNTTGTQNTATGSQALLFNTTGIFNTAVGYQALYSNTIGSFCTAVGSQALFSHTTGSSNAAFGDQALYSYNDNSSTAHGNLAVGPTALTSLERGESNTAVGNASLHNTWNGGNAVNFNTALGRRALFRTQGDQNIGLGFFVGSNLDGGSNNIFIGNVGPDPIGSESNTIRIGQQIPATATIGNVESHLMPAHTAAFIAGISGTFLGGVPVVVDANGQLGVAPSSQRFKDEINPMDKASEAILALQPVTFRYKEKIDPKRTAQFGLVAEEVEKVSPDLVARDAEGKVYTVRYEAVNAMLLNEFLKEHRTVQELKSTAARQEANDAKQEATIARQQKQIDALTAGLQKVSAQVEASKPAPQVVNNP
jgi:hypothetical protein